MTDSSLPEFPDFTELDRMPMLHSDELSNDQWAAVRRIAAGPRGDVFGPFVPLLRSPSAMEHLQQLGAYLRFESPVTNKIFEMLVLVVAIRWDQGFEWNYHLPLARAAGLSELSIEAIASRSNPPDLDSTERAAYDVVCELLTDGFVSDDTYARVTDLLGTQSFIDVVVTAGYYSTLAMVMNAARTPSS